MTPWPALAVNQLGHIPSGGETVQVDGWSLEVLEVDKRTIRRLRPRPQPGGADATDR